MFGVENQKCLVGVSKVKRSMNLFETGDK